MNCEEQSVLCFASVCLQRHEECSHRKQQTEGQSDRSGSCTEVLSLFLSPSIIQHLLEQSQVFQEDSVYSQAAGGRQMGNVGTTVPLWV